MFVLGSMMAEFQHVVVVFAGEVFELDFKICKFDHQRHINSLCVARNIHTVV